jgi:sugar transferase (PEP-CTERM system associated)
MLRIFNHYVSRTFLLLSATEGLILLLSVYAGVATLGLSGAHGAEPVGLVAVAAAALVFSVIMIAAMTAMGLYDPALRAGPRSILARICMSFLSGLGLMALVFRSFPGLFLGDGVFAVALVCSFSGIATCRLICFGLTEQLLLRRVVILGAGQQAQLVEQLRRRTDRRGIDIVGFIDLDAGQRTIADKKLVNLKGSLLDFVAEHDISEIVLALDDRRNSNIIDMNAVLACKMKGVSVIDAATFFERQMGKIPLDSLSVNSVAMSDAYAITIRKCVSKRLSDIFFSSILLILALPVMTLVALAIRIESNGAGPIIYRQTRVGKGGKVFDVLKFRSMRVDAEQNGVAQWAHASDPRVTRIGSFIRKTRLDELPQLINVLKGDMSFVGPRPERPQFVKEWSDAIPNYALRHLIKPGITGWAQIRYPYGASVADAKEKLQYDLYYLKNYSLFLDLAVIVQTPQVVLFGKGAR